MCDIKNCNNQGIETLLIDNRGNLDLCKIHSEMMSDYFKEDGL